MKKILTTPFSKGLIGAALYYAVAGLLTWLTYIIWGHDYIHGPGLHHLFGFLALVAGAIWILVGVVRLFLNKQDKRNIGSLLMNVVVVSSVITYFLIDINRGRESATIEDEGDFITIQQDASTNSSSIISGVGDTILLQVEDSLIIDNTKEWSQRK